MTENGESYEARAERQPKIDPGGTAAILDGAATAHDDAVTDAARANER
jgi:hypothetical protein